MSMTAHPHQCYITDCVLPVPLLPADGKDPLADAWVGNMSIEPAKGKKPVTGISAALDHLHGPLPKEGPAGELLAALL
jgi:hypothetical protein